jgi:predicted GIY-YIG superfamily endonuclease
MLQLTDMGVYYIKNKITDKIYIGSATNGIKRRWNEHELAISPLS